MKKILIVRSRYNKTDDLMSSAISVLKTKKIKWSHI